MEATNQAVRLTVDMCIDEWLEACARRGLKPSTVFGYRTMAKRYVSLEIREMPVETVTTRHVEALYEALRRSGTKDGRGVAPGTLRNLHTILNQTFARAVRLGLIERNPVYGTEVPSARACRSFVASVWSPEELRRFLLATRSCHYWMVFRLAAATGLRRGELLGLRWCDLELEQGYLQVRQTLLVVGRKLLLDSPKSRTSARRVDLDERTVAELRRYKLARERRQHGFVDLTGSSELVFQAEGGGPIHPALVTYHFVQQAKLAGVRRIRFHDLRHTHATHALQAGVHPKVVSERLGHASVMITLDIYSHVVPSMQREAAETVAALVGL